MNLDQIYKAGNTISHEEGLKRVYESAGVAPQAEQESSGTSEELETVREAYIDAITSLTASDEALTHARATIEALQGQLTAMTEERDALAKRLASGQTGGEEVKS